MKVGFLHLLTLIFVLAKLFKAITWSWWLVFTPSIISVCLGLMIIAFVGAVAWFIDD